MKKVINDAHAPNPIGSYNQGVVSNGFIFTSGQIPIDPDTGKMIAGSYKDKTRQVFKNIPLHKISIERHKENHSKPQENPRGFTCKSIESIQYHLKDPLEKRPGSKKKPARC